MRLDLLRIGALSIKKHYEIDLKLLNENCFLNQVMEDEFHERSSKITLGS